MLLVLYIHVAYIDAWNKLDLPTVNRHNLDEFK